MANRFWVGGTGNWDASTTHWSATSGGAAGASVPTATDDVYFDANSGGGTVTVFTALRTCLNLSFRGLSGTSDFTGTFAGVTTLNISGGLTLSASTTYTYSSTISFLAISGSYDITSNGKTLVCSININGLGGTFNLIDGLTTSTSAGSFILTAGTLNLGSSTHNIFSFNSSNSNVRTLNFGTATVNITGNNATVWSTSTNTNLTILGTPTINCTYSGSVGTRGVNFGSPIESNTINVNITAGTDSISLSAGNYKSINFTGFSGSATISNITIYKDLTLSSTQTLPSVGSITFAGTSVTQTITSNNITIPTATLTINSSTTTIQNTGTLTTTGALTITAGTFNINSNLIITGVFTLTAGTLSLNNGANVTSSTFIAPVSNIRTVNLGSGTWTLTGTGNVWNISVATNLTINAGTSRILITDTSATLNTFAGGSFTYYTVEYARGGGGGQLNFIGVNTITNFIDVTSTAAHSITMASTTSFYRFIVKGSAGQLITVGRSATGSPVITKLGRGIVSNCDYLNIVSTGFSASPASTWYAGANSTGSATGWVMTAPPSSQSTLGIGGVG
jgi:hypothetical protein